LAASAHRADPRRGLEPQPGLEVEGLGPPVWRFTPTSGRPESHRNQPSAAVGPCMARPDRAGRLHGRLS